MITFLDYQWFSFNLSFTHFAEVVDGFHQRL